MLGGGGGDIHKTGTAELQLEPTQTRTEDKHLVGTHRRRRRTG